MPLSKKQIRLIVIRRNYSRRSNSSYDSDIASRYANHMSIKLHLNSVEEKEAYKDALSMMRNPESRKHLVYEYDPKAK